MESLSTTCVIAGGGPAGMMCAYLLARAGVDVTVIEKHKDFLRDFRGDTVHPSTLDLMDELGLLDKFLALPHSRVETLRIEIGARSFAVADFTRIPGRCKFLVLMPQWDLLDFLAREARRFPNFHLLMQTEARDLLTAGGRIAGVLATGPNGTLAIRAGLTIAADGRHSTCRAKSGLPVKEIGAPFDVLWFRLPFEQGDPRDVVGRIEGGHLLVMIYRTDYWQCAFAIPKGSFDALKAEGLGGFRGRLRAVAGFARDRVDAIKNFDEIRLLTVTIDRLEEWARPGLLCIGDAAHAMSPVGGVGINLAIQDAVASANVLGAALGRGVPKFSDLKRVQRRRDWPTRVIQWFQVAAQNRILAPTLRRTTTPKPPRLLELFDRHPALRRWPAQFIGIGPRPEHVKIGR